MSTKVKYSELLDSKLDDTTVASAEEQKDPIPYYVYEATVVSHERVKTKLIKAIIIISLSFLIALVGTNGAWLWYNSQYETIDYVYTQDGKGTNIIGTENEMLYGTEISRPN